MKLSIASAIAIAALGTASVSALADDRPETKGPPQTMGDEGKLLPAKQCGMPLPT